MDNHVSGQKFNIPLLARSQTALVIAIIIWFLIGAVLTRIGIYPPNFPPTGQIGLIAVIAGTFARLLMVAEQFRRARLYRLWLLCYMLILLISAPIIGELVHR